MNSTFHSQIAVPPILRHTRVRSSIRCTWKQSTRESHDVLEAIDFVSSRLRPTSLILNRYRICIALRIFPDLSLPSARVKGESFWIYSGCFCWCPHARRHHHHDSQLFLSLRGAAITICRVVKCCPEFVTRVGVIALTGGGVSAEDYDPWGMGGGITYYFSVFCDVTD